MWCVGRAWLKSGPQVPELCTSGSSAVKEGGNRHPPPRVVERIKLVNTQKALGTKPVR